MPFRRFVTGGGTSGGSAGGGGSGQAESSDAIMPIEAGGQILKAPPIPE